MNTSDPLEMPPINQTNGKRKPMETRNGKDSCSGSHIESVDPTDRDHDKDTTVLCIAQETLDNSDTEDPSIEDEQNQDEMLVNVNTTDFEHTCNDSESCSENSTVFAVRDQEDVEENVCYSHKKVNDQDKGGCVSSKNMHNRNESQEKVKDTSPLIDESVNHSETDGIVSQDQQKEDIGSSMDNHEKEEGILEIISKSESTGEYMKNENWDCVIEDGSALSNKSTMSEYLNQDFCVVDESPSNMELKHLVLPEQTKKGYEFSGEETSEDELLNDAANVCNSKATKEIKDGQKYERIQFMVKWLGITIFTLIVTNYASIVVDLAKYGIGGVGKFGDANQEQRATTFPNSDISIYVRNSSKPKVNGFNATLFFECQDVINSYWKQILKRVVITSECHDAISVGTKWSFKELFVCGLRDNYVQLFSSFRQIVHFVEIESSDGESGSESDESGYESGYDGDDEYFDDAHDDYLDYNDALLILPDQGVNSENGDFLDSVIYNQVNLDYVNADEVLENDYIDVSESDYIEDDELDDNVDFNYFRLDDEIVYALPDQQFSSENGDSFVFNQITLDHVNPNRILENSCIQDNESGYEADDELEDSEDDHDGYLDGDFV